MVELTIFNLKQAHETELGMTLPCVHCPAETTLMIVKSQAADPFAQDLALALGHRQSAEKRFNRFLGDLFFRVSSSQRRRAERFC